VTRRSQVELRDEAVAPESLPPEHGHLVDFLANAERQARPEISLFFLKVQKGHAKTSIHLAISSFSHFRANFGSPGVFE
jgi:hypothetical protein